jgi:plastocyanin
MNARTKVATTVFVVSACALLASAASLNGTVKTDASGASIVYLEPAGGPAPVTTASKEYVVTQQGMKFLPQVLAITPGSTVVFKNDDAPAHKVSWASIGGDKKMAHNLGTFPRGQQRSYKFDHVGIVPLLCSLHSEMDGYIIVSPTPYYGQTESTLGMYQITNIPDGQYKVTAWHAGKKPVFKIVSVNGTVKLDFDLSR